VPGHRMLSIWFFVGLMLTVFGVIVTATGVYFVFRPQNATVLAELNPSLWWGLIMLAAGVLFLLPSIRTKMGRRL
jgi:hypothetical protein